LSNPKNAVDPLIAPLVLGDHTVPGIWRYMLPYEFLGLDFPSERESTCLDCPRIVSDNYRQDYRCCTYFPKVPNYMLGLAFQNDKSTRPLIKQQLKSRFLLPEGMQESARMYADFIEQVAKEEFGQGEKTLCPYLNKENGYCGIYLYRNSVCSTFFCKNNHGDKGQKFWDEITTLVMQIELALSQWSLEEIGFDYSSYISRLNKTGNQIDKTFEPQTRKWSEKTYNYLWGSDVGNELDIYRECANVIEKNRNNLWEIANSVNITESIEYEKSANKLVLKKYKDEIPPDGSLDDITVSPQDIYKDVVKKHHNMWSLPNSPLVLNSKVVLSNSTRGNKKLYEVSLKKRKVGNAIEWTCSVEKGVFESLEIFKQMIMPGFDTMEKIRSLTGEDSKIFLSEWFSKNVLVKKIPPKAS